MKTPAVGLTMVLLLDACILGCASVSELPRPKPVSPPPSPAAKAPPVRKPKPRQWSDKQLNLLRTFALQESPKLWQTVQALRAEHDTRTAALARLRSELQDFGRNPDADPDYVALKTANDGLLESLSAIYAKIEDAYIAYKKFLATPGNKAYNDMMRKVLDDGMNEASAAESRFMRMSREK